MAFVPSHNPHLPAPCGAGATELTMAVERTLSIIKPDAVAKNVIGQILARFESAGLKRCQGRGGIIARIAPEDYEISGPMMRVRSRHVMRM